MGAYFDIGVNVGGGEGVVGDEEAEGDLDVGSGGGAAVAVDGQRGHAVPHVPPAAEVPPLPVQGAAQGGADAGPKAWNLSISRFRILIKHVNRRIKRFKIFPSRYRNKQRKHLMRLSLVCGIYNHELRFSNKSIIHLRSCPIEFTRIFTEINKISHKSTTDIKGAFPSSPFPPMIARLGRFESL